MASTAVQPVDSPVPRTQYSNFELRTLTPHIGAEIHGVDLSQEISSDLQREIGEAWRPYRAVAARILWHHYLNTKRLKRKDATP